MNWRADFHSTKKRDRQFFRHAHATMRCRIPRQVASMHSSRLVKPHEVTHWSRDEFPAARYLHVGVGISYNRVASRIHDFAVHRRIMVSLFLNDLETTGFAEMAVASA